MASPMRRMAVVAPNSRVRRVLIEVADSGSFEPDASRSPADGPATLRSGQAAAPDGTLVEALLLATDMPPADMGSLSPALLAGEASLEHRSGAATTTAQCAVLPGWIPARDVEDLANRINPFGGALAELPLRRGATPPTHSVAGGLGSGLRPLVTTYATVPYRNVDPTLFAGITYMVMFGMMFGDVAHGAAVVILGLVARASRSERFKGVHRAAPFLIGAGLAAIGFGFLYGEAFGPTGLVPTLWLRPLDEPETLLVAGLVIGSCLLAITFLLGSIDRWREAGARGALYDASGIGGALMFAGAAAFIGGITIDSAAWLEPAGLGVAAVGALLTFVGLFTKAGLTPGGLMQALIEMFDTVLRLGSNIVSFTRLAAFGLTHAVITEVVWDGTVALWDGSGVVSIIAAVVLFAVGNIAAFALSGLVGAIQALRLEYYELFSRLFVTQGRPFTPWHIPSQAPGPTTPAQPSTAQPSAAHPTHQLETP